MKSAWLLERSEGGSEAKHTRQMPALLKTLTCNLPATNDEEKTAWNDRIQIPLIICRRTDSDWIERFQTAPLLACRRGFGSNHFVKGLCLALVDLVQALAMNRKRVRQQSS